MKVAVPTLDDLFAVISAATFGDASARVALPDDPPVDDAATRTAIALNVLLDDLAFRNRATEQMAARLRTLADSAQAFSLATHDSEQLSISSSPTSSCPR